MLMKLVAKKKKKQSLQTFFIWQHDRVLWIVFPRRSAFTVQLKTDHKGKIHELLCIFSS